MTPKANKIPTATTTAVLVEGLAEVFGVLEGAELRRELAIWNLHKTFQTAKLKLLTIPGGVK